MKRSKSLSAISILIIAALSIGGWLYLNKDSNNILPGPWDRSNEANNAVIDHSLWNDFLAEYVITGDQSGLYLVDYENALGAGKNFLLEYIASLEKIDPRAYTRKEQMAYWINLYNSLTIKLILDNYPVESITILGQNSLSFGPWDDPVTMVAGESLSLNNIEHGILRPIWQDPRIHFAVNCASFGCPNVQARAFTGANLEFLLDEAARQYLSHPRAAHFDGTELVLSSIFKWYADDFGNNTAEVLQHISTYAPAVMAERLKSYNGEIRFEYDWKLNGY